ncbi:MAG: hypothetical protein C0402_03250 [Thermodesulfovibrio sp.]|nr:hypothetical protein [Thermodesulfovibrio sp.]
MNISGGQKYGMVSRDKRKFRRYQKTREVPITFRNRVIRARIVDYSLDGVGVLVEGSTVISKGDIVNITMSNPENAVGGEVVWSCIEPAGVRLGVRTKGLFSGLINDFRFADTLIGLHRNRKTGIMTIQYGPVTKKIYIRDGDMIFSASNQQEDRLGDVLLKQGRITTEQYDRTVEEMRKTGLKQGVALVKLGYLKPQELVPVIRQQVEQIILSLFTLQDGSFEFKETPLPPDAVITLKLSPSNLIYYGIRRMDNTADMLSELPELGSIPVLSPDSGQLFQDISLDSAGRQVVDLIDGNKTLGQILKSVGVSEDETIKVLYALFCARLLLVQPHTEAAAQAEAGEASVQADEAPADAARSGADPFDAEGIHILHAGCRETGYYEVLGLTKTATSSEIKKAYYTAAKKYHPDIHFTLDDASVKGKLSDIFSYIYEAYATLSVPEKRREYDAKKQVKAEAKDDKQTQARRKFAEGRAAFNSRIYREAELLFGQATYFDNRVAVYHYYYGLALLRQNRMKPAVKAFERASVLEPLNADYPTELGFVFLQLGFPTRARSFFEKALKISPGLKRAAEGLTELAGR